MSDPTTGTLYLVYSGLHNEPARMEQDGRTHRDAKIVSEGSTLKYHYRYASVVFEAHEYTSVADAVSKIKQFEADGRAIQNQPAAHKTVALRPNGGPGQSEAIARILLCEAEEGSVGETEQKAVYERFLDFGEHSVAVSPAGIAVCGTVDEEQVQTYLYYVAQISAAISRYAYNESVLSDVMTDIKQKSKALDVEKLQEINISTSKAMLDINDELLDISPRESFILRQLLEVANVDIYEQRVSRMLNLIQHHVQHQHSLRAKKDSQRIELVLFIIAMLGGLSGLTEIFGNSAQIEAAASQNHMAGIMIGVALMIFAIIATGASAVWFYRRRQGETD